MRLRFFAGFLAGIIFTVALIGSTTWLRADDANVIHACANKRTGVLRYIAKGSCTKKTETAISWGVIGPAGPQGPMGESGAKGESGKQGEAGAKGTPGARALVVDATDKNLGVWAWTNFTGNFAVLDSSGAVWLPSTNVYGFANEALVYFRDSSCTVPLIQAPSSDALPSPSDRYVLQVPNDSTEIVGAYKTAASGRPFRGSSLSGVYVWRGISPAVCTNDKSRPGNTMGDYSGIYFWDATSVDLPPYTPPLRVEYRE